MANYRDAALLKFPAVESSENFVIVDAKIIGSIAIGKGLGSVGN
jgi:hypothetical protein